MIAVLSDLRLDKTGIERFLLLFQLVTSTFLFIKIKKVVISQAISRTRVYVCA